MTRRTHKRFFAPRCRDCGMAREKDEMLAYGGYCPDCVSKRREQKRQDRGARQIAKAQEAGTQIIDGKTYTVLRLPRRTPR